MAEQEKIKLTDLLGACLDFKREPTPENDLAIKAIVNSFIIKEYLPLADKLTQLSLILGNITSDSLDQFEAEMWVVIGKVVYGILAYVDNLENDLDKLSMSAQVVDLLYEMGVVDNVLEHCEKDYHRLEKMLDETMNFSNIFRIVETTRLYNSDSIDKFVEELESFKKDLTPEMLENMKSIANASDPAFKAFKDTVVDEVLNRVMDVDFKDLKGAENSEKPEETKEEKKESGEA